MPLLAWRTFVTEKKIVFSDLSVSNSQDCVFSLPFIYFICLENKVKLSASKNKKNRAACRIAFRQAYVMLATSNGDNM